MSLREVVPFHSDTSCFKGPKQSVFFSHAMPTSGVGTWRGTSVEALGARPRGSSDAPWCVSSPYGLGTRGEPGL